MICTVIVDPIYRGDASLMRMLSASCGAGVDKDDLGMKVVLMKLVEAGLQK